MRGIPYWSHQCPGALVSLAVTGASAEFYQLQLWSFVGRNYLGVNLHHSVKVVQVLVNVAEPAQKAGEILGRLGCAPTASRAGINMP